MVQNVFQCVCVVIIGKKSDCNIGNNVRAFVVRNHVHS